MTKRKNKGKGVRAKKPRIAKKKAAKKVKRLPKFQSEPQSGSADAEGGTPASPPSIQEEAMRLGAEPDAVSS